MVQFPSHPPEQRETPPMDEIENGDQHAVNNREENDLGREEVWQQQERIMNENREKRDRLRRRLERQKQIAQEKLREEQERIELIQMEQEIKEINNRRRAIRDQRRANEGDEGPKTTPRQPEHNEYEQQNMPEVVKKKKNSRPATNAEVTRTLPLDDHDSDGESAISRLSINTTSRNAQSQCGSRHEYISGVPQRKELRSGFLDKPRSQVVHKQRWPHMNQNPRYVTESLHFNSLSFPQFVGGGV